MDDSIDLSYRLVDAGDFIIPKLSYWRCFIDEHHELIEDCFDIWPGKVKVVSVMHIQEICGHSIDVEYIEFTFKGVSGILFTQDIDELIRGD